MQTSTITDTEKMKPVKLIKATPKLGYTKLYIDFINGSMPASGLYQSLKPEEVALEVSKGEYHRNDLCEILIAQNKLYDASSKTLSNIELLRDPRSLCIFSGQQAGLLGGPLLTLIKALGIIKAAGKYSRELDCPVVPVFWIAGDDHDFEEANHTYSMTRNGELCKQIYSSSPPFQNPTAEIFFSDPKELELMLNRVEECHGESDFTPNLYELIRNCYTKDDTFVTAFGKFMTTLTAEYGLIFFSPGDEAAKKLAVPFFKQIISCQVKMHDLLINANRMLEDSGYHVQVKKKDEATHLFYHQQGRHPILREGSNFTVGEKKFSQTELLDLIEKEPHNFSPDVITRPLLQSHLFPVLSQKGGPAEIAYLAQINPLFKLFDIPLPIHKARPTATLVEKRVESLLELLDINFEELPGDIEQVVNKVLAKTFPSDIENDFNTLRRSIEDGFLSFRNEAIDFDPNLKKVAEQTKGKIDFLLKGFEGKVFSTHKKKSQETRDRIYRIAAHLYPLNNLQERTLNICYFIARYGMNIVPYLYDNLDSQESSHQLISMREYNI